MIRILILAALALVACAPGPAPSPHPSISATPAPVPSGTLPPSAPPASCVGASPVYHPARLRPLGACATFHGIVLAVLSETDGDHHLWIAPDAGYASFLDAGNLYHGQPALVAEIVPACTSEPADSSAAAHCPASALTEPTVREHVEVVGPWVNDQVHGWNEVHPVVAIRALPGGPPPGMQFPAPGPSDAPDE